jgi:hypothetical protein
MWLWLAIGCGVDGFLDTPDDPMAPGTFQLRSPSLAGCTYELGDASNRQQPLGLDVTLTYDARGRLRHSLSAVGVTASTAEADYDWRGDCLIGVHTTHFGYEVQDDYVCDDHDQWVSQVETWSAGAEPFLSRVFANTYDVLGQLVHQEASDPSGVLLSTQDLFWDGDGRLLQLDTTDLAGGTEEVKRTNTWDHDRLLGWYDKNVGDDLKMTRSFERHRLMTQSEILVASDEEKTETTVYELSWTYDGDDVWPITRTLTQSGLPVDQPITVTCGP